MNYEKIFLEKYSILNPEQKKAVDNIDGPVFVMAGPGTGKTQILTLRIANILRTAADIEPENILALTFTNAAAYNMRQRLAEMVGGELAYRVHISTFHSFAEEMMKKNPEYFDYFAGARLLSPVEQIEILEEIIESKKNLIHFSKFKRRESTVKSIAFSIGKIKGESYSVEGFLAIAAEKFESDKEDPKMFYKRASGENKKGDLKISELRKLEARFEKTKELAEIYEDYEEKLRNKKLYDFSDLILAFTQELESDSEFQTEMQEQFHYMLVDEHQDTNDAQNKILHALIDNPVWEGKPNIFVVGDSKQAIFRFAGASEGSYTNLLSKLSDVVFISLEHNYRSHQNILDTSHALIKKAKPHEDEALLSAFFDHGGKLEYRKFSSYKMENLFVAQAIRDQVNSGTPAEEIAVLYRNNRDGTDIRHLLSVYGIPVQDFSKKDILQDADMLKMFLLLGAIHNLRDDELVAKSLYINFLEFNVYDISKILTGARSARIPEQKKIFGLISDGDKLKKLGIEDTEVKKFVSYAQTLQDLKSFSENNDIVSFYSEFIRNSGFLNYVLSQADSALGLSKIEKFFDEIKKEFLARENFNIGDLMRYLHTLKKHKITMATNSVISKGVQLMTFHASKGLEFDHVYIIRATAKRKVAAEISLPFAEFRDGEADDERRLLYVALTRAKKECFISSFIVDEQGREKNESQFISDLLAVPSIDVSDWEEGHAGDIIDIFGEEKLHLASLLDPEYIKEIFYKKQLSVSALNNYMESPLKYFFRNLVTLPEARSHFLDFGNLMHESLEEFFNKSQNEQKILGADELKNSFEKVLHSKPQYAEFEDRAWEMLEKYHAEKREDFDLPLHNELYISGIPFEIEEGKILYLSGAIDKITRNENNEIVVWDYKTGRTYSDMDKNRRAKTKRQAVFYKLLLQNYHSGKYNFHEAVFAFLEKNKNGEYEEQRFSVDQSDVEELREDILKLVNDIESGTLLDKHFVRDDANRDLLDFLEIMKGPRTREQKSLF